MVQKNYGAATIWLILVLVLIAGGLYLLTKPDAVTAPETDTTDTTGTFPTGEVPTNPDADLSASGQLAASTTIVVAPKTHTVNYSANGYTPATLSIKEGDTVKFVAATGASMWTASDPHPTHTGLAGFDQKATGSEYSFTFTKAGTYGYHNHRNTSHQGTITVAK